MTDLSYILWFLHYTTRNTVKIVFPSSKILIKGFPCLDQWD